MSDKYTPETEWLRDGDLIYTLKQDGWRKGDPVMQNDVMIRVEGRKVPPAQLYEIIESVRKHLNKEFGI